jgi:hypothetical protein
MKTKACLIPNLDHEIKKQKQEHSKYKIRIWQDFIAKKK